MTISTRMGDGYTVELADDEVRSDLRAGSEEAARRGKIPVLEDSEIDWLFDLFAGKSRFVGVERGHEVVLTKDGSVNSLYGGQMTCGLGIPVGREQAFRIWERVFGFDTMEIGHPDYSFKPVKPIVALEAMGVEQALQGTIIPVFYGSMPNFGLYARPDGPFPNPADLLPTGKIEAAREAQVEIGEACKVDMLYVSRHMAEHGCRRHRFRHRGFCGRCGVPDHAGDGGGAVEDDGPRHRGRHGIGDGDGVPWRAHL